MCVLDIQFDRQSSISYQRTDGTVAVFSNQVRTRHISFPGDYPDAICICITFDLKFTLEKLCVEYKSNTTLFANAFIQSAI
jgi:hypothetical protein